MRKKTSIIIFLTIINIAVIGFLTGCDAKTASDKKVMADPYIFSFKSYRGDFYYSYEGNLYYCKSTEQAKPKRIMDDVTDFFVRKGRFNEKKFKETPDGNKEYIDGRIEAERAFAIRSNQSLWTWFIGGKRSAEDKREGYYFDKEPIQIMENDATEEDRISARPDGLAN